MDTDYPEQPTSRRRKPLGIGRWVTAILLVGVGLYFVSFSVRQLYGYEVGTPATATDIHCRGGDPAAESGDTTSVGDWMLSHGCSAKWTVGGQSQSGPIVGVHHLGSADVHAHGGTAFTAPFSSWFFAGHLLAILLIVAGLGQFWDVSRLWSWLKPSRR
jgi:hypothetical protein